MAFLFWDWLYIMLALVFIVVTRWTLWEGTRQRAPIYQGKPLSYWVRQSQLWQDERFRPEMVQTNLPTPDSRAIPFLMHYLERPQHQFGPFYSNAWQRLPARLQRHLPQPDDPATIQISATEMLHRMGPAAKPAIPALIRILREEKDQWMWICAARVLDQFALEEPSIKAFFDDLGRQFQTKANHDRLEVGRKVQLLLPKCAGKPLSGAMMAVVAGGRIMAEDSAFPAPSYRLSKEQLFGILGRPDVWATDTAVYRLAEYTNNTGRFTNRVHPHLSIRLVDGYVHQSIVCP